MSDGARPAAAPRVARGLAFCLLLCLVLAAQVRPFAHAAASNVANANTPTTNTPTTTTPTTNTPATNTSAAVSAPSVAVLGASASRAAPVSPDPAATTDRRTATVHLVSQRTSVARDEVYWVRVAVAQRTSSPGPLEAALTVFGRINTVAQLDRAIAGRGLDAVQGVTRVQVPDPGDPDTVFDTTGRIVLPPLNIHITDECIVECAALSFDGVYPVQVELRRPGGGATIDTFRTFLHLSEAEAANRLGVALLLPFEEAPQVATLGQGTLATLASPLVTVVDRLGAHRRTPVTLLVAPATLDALSGPARDPDLVTRLRTLVDDPSRATIEVPALPYVMPSSRFYADPRSTGLLDDLKRAGRRTIAERLHAPTASTLVLDDALPTLGQPELEGLGIERVVIPTHRLTEALPSAAVGRTFIYDPGGAEGRGLPAVALDTRLNRRLAVSDPADGVLGVAHLLADLALQADRPANRGAIIAVRVPDKALTSTTLDALLDAVINHPRLRAVTLSDAFSVPYASTDGALVSRLAVSTSTRPLREARLSNVIAVLQRARGYSSLFPTNTNTNTNTTVTPATVPGGRISGDAEGRRLESLTLSALDRGIDDEEASKILGDVRAAIDEGLGHVRLDGPRRFRLTARRGQIPLTIVNDLGRSIRLTAELASDKLTFPGRGGNTAGGLTQRRLVVPAGRTIEYFTVEARASGNFPMRARLITASGLDLSSDAYSVQAAPSGVGIVLTVGAALILVGWWVRFTIRKRRTVSFGRHPATAVPATAVPATAVPAPSDEPA